MLKGRGAFRVLQANSEPWHRGLFLKSYRPVLSLTKTNIFCSKWADKRKDSGYIRIFKIHEEVKTSKTKMLFQITRFKAIFENL